MALHAFTFFKDNEYFNNIIEGYTLFGTQLNPQVVYYPTANLRLEGGVFLWKDFGTAQLRQVRPTFRATYTVQRPRATHEIVLGNIRPHLAHGYIEPLFNFERVMLRPLEEGLQYRLLSQHVELDTWVDWVRQQYRFSNFQEEIAGGVRGSIRVPVQALDVHIPVQFTATHRGGQIDTIDRPLQTLFNGATGLEARFPYFSGASWVQAVRVQAYGVGFLDRSFTYELPYRRGAALYLNATAETRWLDVMLSYWQGQRFVAPLGGDLYQSVSRTVGNPTYTEPNRRLLFVRLLRDFSLGDAAALTVRLEPVYDFQARSTDFSLGVYLNFRQEWLLGKVDSRVR